MRVEGMRDGEMALPLTEEGQDKRQLPRIHPLHEVLGCIIYSNYFTSSMILVSPCLMYLKFDT